MIPLLAASEKGKGQAESAAERQLEMWCTIISKWVIQNELESFTSEGDSPVE